jgi:hypothetical protein
MWESKPMPRGGTRYTPENPKLQFAPPKGRLVRVSQQVHQVPDLLIHSGLGDPKPAEFGIPRMPSSGYFTPSGL